MHFSKRKIFSVFCFVLSSFIYGQEETNRPLQFGAGFHTSYSIQTFNNTDFSGANLFEYRNRMQYGYGLLLEKPAKSVSFRAELRLSDFGWDRIDTANIMENAQLKLTRYAYRYAVIVPQIGFSLIQRERTELGAYSGIGAGILAMKSFHRHYKDGSVQVVAGPEINPSQLLAWATASIGLDRKITEYLGIKLETGIIVPFNRISAVVRSPRVSASAFICCYYSFSKKK